MPEQVIVTQTAPDKVRDGDVVFGKVVNLAVDKEYRTPFTTIGLLFKSRRFLVLIGYALAVVIFSLVPSLAPLAEFIPQITIAVVFLIGGYTVNDAIAEWNKNKGDLPTDQRDLLLELIEELIDNALNRDETPEIPPTG